MARKRKTEIKPELVWPDAEADAHKSKTVRFFRPVDWDIDENECSVEWAHYNTGWFWLDSANIWQGPFMTSTEAHNASQK